MTCLTCAVENAFNRSETVSSEAYLPSAPPNFKSMIQDTKDDHRYNSNPNKTLGDNMKE